MMNVPDTGFSEDRRQIERGESQVKVERGGWVFNPIKMGTAAKARVCG